MDKVIKEGTLRLQITESTCDVILSCNGHRLLAHKLILSIASPVLRKLLIQDADTTSVIILPDINGNTMSLILDYIYTGRAMLYTSSVQEFLSVAKFLQISIDISSIEENLIGVHNLHKINDYKKLDLEDGNSIKSLEKPDKMEHPVKKIDLDCFSVLPKYRDRKPQRKVPDLLPINNKILTKNMNKKLGNFVVPSPWRPRDEGRFMGDPRIVPLDNMETEVLSKTLPAISTQDKNNNSPSTPNTELKCSSKKLDDIIRNLYLNNAESSKDKRSNTSDQNANQVNSTLDSTVDHIKTNVNQSKTGPNNTDRTERCSRKSQTPCEIPKFSFLRRFIQMTSESSTKNNNSNEQTLNDSSERSENDTSPSKKPKAIFPLPNENKKSEAWTSPNDLTKKQTDIEPDPSSNSNDVISNDNSSDSCTSDSSGDDKKDETEAKKKPFKCEDCGKCFSQLRNYKYHRSVHEGTKEFSAKCQECGKTFNDRGYLSSHMKIHRDKKEYACPNCPKRFNQRVAYNMHLRIHTGVKPHECPTCGKSFSRKMLLKQHQRVHTGERPYSCPECGKTFADRSNMSLHARLHTGVKPYACNLCPKSFTKKHHLKTHMNFHTGLKPYSCDNCGLAFSQSSNMRTHFKKCILKETRTNTKDSSTNPENSS